MKYPFVLLFRLDKYSYIDTFFKKNKDKLLCSVFITNKKEELNKLFNSNYQILITFGDDESEIINDVNSIISDRMRKQWIHLKTIDNVDKFNESVNFCYIHNIAQNQDTTNMRPIFSLFTTCYNSYKKIYRAYNSIKAQTLKDWEWVILDDSPDDKHFKFLKDTFKNDNRIRLYKRSENSGSIGNVKNEAVCLCRGKYVIEMDHDDEILPNCLLDATNVFDKDEDVGFVYMDFINIYEDKKNFRYSDFFGLGYCGYYRQKYNNNWVYVCSTPNINNITLSHIVSVPNHPRIWRRTTLLEIGNYSEYLPVSDDYELLIRTAVKTKMVKIHKLGYVQYMNDGGNNFSYIRNGEINRLLYHIRDHHYNKYVVHETMKTLNAYEDERYINNHSQIWKRTDYEHKHCNEIINLNYKKQYCIIGLENLHKNLDEIRSLYTDTQNDFILLDNKYNSDSSELCIELDKLCLDRFRCYSMDDCSNKQLVKYFMLVYKSCEDYHIYDRDDSNPDLQEEIDGGYELYDENETSGNDDTKERKKVTLITPSIRPQNLIKIKESIRFDYVNEWIIVYDGTKITENPNLFINDENKDKIKEYLHIGEGISGNPQRNFALDNITNTNTYLYYLDDDNIIHPDLYALLDNIKDDKIYTFDQIRPPNIFPFTDLLPGNNIEVWKIDSAMFLVDYNLCKNVRWVFDKYWADGIYIVDCYKQNKSKWVYVPKVLSYCNYATSENQNK